MIPVMPNYDHRPAPESPRCGSCRQPGGPFVVMENARSYCVRCAVEIREATGLTSANLRADAPRLR